MTAALGLVSRASSVHTAMRNCTGDEGRSFEFDNQVLISSHRKPLWSKARVVNVAESRDQVAASMLTEDWRCGRTKRREAITAWRQC
jgi:hypothetical protein